MLADGRMPVDGRLPSRAIDEVEQDLIKLHQPLSAHADRADFKTCD